MIFDRHANLKYKYGRRQFWCEGYYVDTVGKNTKKIAEYAAHSRKVRWRIPRLSRGGHIQRKNIIPQRRRRNKGRQD